MGDFIKALKNIEIVETLSSVNKFFFWNIKSRIITIRMSLIAFTNDEL